MVNKKNIFYLAILIWHTSSIAFSAAYYYELYIHNEYFAEPPGFPSKFILSPIFSSFSIYNNAIQEDRLAGGLIAALRLTHNHTWIELITAIGKERVRLHELETISKKSRSGMDDFLIDIGHNFLDATGKKQLLVHWLTGIPLTKKVSLIEINQPLWGTRTYATGPVIEAIYDFVRNQEYDIFIGLITRFLHRFKRHYTPILPPDALLNPGNSLDVLALLHYRHYGQNIEVGYIYSTVDNVSYRFIDHTQRFPSERYHSLYADYFYYSEQKEMGFEINLAKTFGKTYEGYTIFGAITWYF